MTLAHDIGNQMKQKEPTKPGAPAGIWPVVRAYDAEEWGGGL